MFISCFVFWYQIINVLITLYLRKTSSLAEVLNILSFTFPGINAVALITLLGMKNVQVSAGSACCSGENVPSRTLKAIGLFDEDAFSTIRVSIGTNTTKEECDEFVRILVECLTILKVMK